MSKYKEKNVERLLCEDCPWKMTCLGVQTAPCTVQNLDLNELYKFFPAETVKRLIQNIFEKQDLQT